MIGAERCFEQSRRQLMKGDDRKEGGYLWGMPFRRIEAGLSQEEAAEACGISQRQIRRYEKHEAKAHPASLHRLATALKCRIKDLFVEDIVD